MVCSRGRDESAGGVGGGELLFCQLFGVFPPGVYAYFGYSQVVRRLLPSLQQEGWHGRNKESTLKQDVKQGQGRQLQRQRQLLPPIAEQATPWDTGMLVTRSWKSRNCRNGKSWRI